MKKLSTMVLALVIAVSLPACRSSSSDIAVSSSSSGSNSSNIATNAEPVTIRFSTIEIELSDEQIKDFEEAHPNIKIALEDTDTTELAAQLAAGEAPDIIRINAVDELASYVIRGIAMDLDSYIANSEVIYEDDLLPVTDVYRFDGKTLGQGPRYGLPKDWSPDFTVWYNKKLFDAANVQVPDASKPLTWSQLFELAHKLTLSEGDDIKQFGLASSEAYLPFLMQYMLSKEVKIFSDDFTRADFAKQEAKESIAQWVEAVKGNYGPNTINQYKSGWSGELFINDKAAMLITGYWFSSVIRGDEKMKTHLDDYGLLPAPIADGGQRVSPTGSAVGAIINKNTEHPEEAWKVFEWYYGGKPAEERAKNGWGVPALKHLMPLLPQETDFDKRVYSVLNDELNYNGKFLEVNPFLLNGSTIFNKHMTPVYFDKSTLDDALNNMNMDANLSIKETMNVE